MDSSAALTKATQTMGIQSLKPKQLEALQSFLSGKDTFVILPTGYGKSIIYGILPRVFDYIHGRSGSIVVVVTPLTALMLDQKKKFTDLGIITEFVGGAQDDEAAIAAVLQGKIQLVYISPECIIRNKKFRGMFHKDAYQDNLVALVVDEAHCVKLWGDAFRKSFAEIGTLRSILPKSVNVLALTATATKQTVDCVVERLSMKEPAIIGANVGRGNIKYIVKPRIAQTELCALLSDELLTSRVSTPKTVVFCRTLLSCGNIYGNLKKQLGSNITEPPGLPNLVEFRLINLFTAATTSRMREKILTEFCKDGSTLRVIIATSTFGLGVDCGDITRIINWGAPCTLEELLQETGRAGRNGAPSEAILYSFNVGGNTSKVMKEYLDNVNLCRRQLLLSNFMFCEDTVDLKYCRCCDVCSASCDCTDCNNCN